MPIEATCIANLKLNFFIKKETKMLQIAKAA